MPEPVQLVIPRAADLDAQLYVSEDERGCAQPTETGWTDCRRRVCWRLRVLNDDCLHPGCREHGGDCLREPGPDMLVCHEHVHDALAGVAEHWGEPVLVEYVR
jgi:hypothetical protein